MRVAILPWGIFTIALLITLLLQTAAVPLARVEWLDLLLVLALVCGLAAPLVEARLAGWITGFAQDVASSDPIGLHAFVLGLTVLGLTFLRERVNQNLWWARWLIAFLVALPAQFMLLLHRRLLQGAATSWSEMITGALLTAVVAALLAALMVGLPALVSARRRRRVPRW